MTISLADSKWLSLDEVRAFFAGGGAAGVRRAGPGAGDAADHCLHLAGAGEGNRRPDGNGSESINHDVSRLLGKLLIGQTKSRPRHSNDNGLVEAELNARAAEPCGTEAALGCNKPCANCSGASGERSHEPGNA